MNLTRERKHKKICQTSHTKTLVRRSKENRYRKRREEKERRRRKDCFFFFVFVFSFIHFFLFNFAYNSQSDQILAPNNPQFLFHFHRIPNSPRSKFASISIRLELCRGSYHHGVHKGREQIGVGGAGAGRAVLGGGDNGRSGGSVVQLLGESRDL